MPKRNPYVEPQSLTAVIGRKARTYYLSEEQEHRRADDEAILDEVCQLRDQGLRATEIAKRLKIGRASVYGALAT